MWCFYTFWIVERYNHGYLFCKYQFVKEFFSEVSFINDNKVINQR